MAKSKVVGSDFLPTKNNVFVTDLEHGVAVTRGGIIVPDDDMKIHGIHERWACVWKTGPEVDDLFPGDWILIEHGRWTPAINLELDSGPVTVWRVDYPAAVLLAADTDPRNRVLR